MEESFRPPADPGFRLIETFRWTRYGGIRHGAEHIARFRHSADALGLDPSGAEAELDRLTGEGPLRVRLTLDARGQAEISVQSFEILPPDTVWRVGLADERLRACDPWLRHKTTFRGAYDAARAALPPHLDEAILLNEAGQVCDGTITTVFADLGDGLLTPPLRCGLLPGVLRERLLAAAKVREAVLTPDDLHRAARLFVGNSLRGLIQAKMA